MFGSRSLFTYFVVMTLLTVVSSEPADAQRRPERNAPAPAEQHADVELFEPAVDPTFYQAMEWRMIGPFRGGRSNASTGVRGEPLTFYFGGVGSGVWKTTDGGENWKNVSDEKFGTASVGAIAVSESDQNTVYVGMGEHAVRGVMTSHGDGIYRSDDAGHSWRHLGLDSIRQVSELVIHPSDPDTVYVAAQGAPYGPTEERGVYRTTDGGDSWQKVHFVSRNAGASGLSMDPNNPRVLYVAYWDHLRTPWEIRSGGPGSSVWKTIDAGDTWERLGETEADGLPETKGKIDVSVAPNSDRVYVLVEADPGGGVYRSDDRGVTFTKTNEDWGLRARAWYYIKIYADPVDPDTVWVTNASTYKSIDAGKTFTRVATPHGDNHHLWFDPDNPNRMINSNDGGANISQNGGQTWSTQQNQPTAQFYRVNVDNQIPYHVYGGQQDNSAIGIKSSSPGGIGWADFYSVAGCESAWAAFDPDDPKYIYGGCYMGIIDEWNRTTRKSRGVQAYTMMPAAMASRDMRYRFNWSAPIVASPQNPDVIYHGGNVVLRTSDRGNSWQEVSPDLTRNESERQGKGGGPITNEGAGGEIYGTVYTMAASGLEEGVLWTGSDDGLIHVTRDGGATWQNVTPAGSDNDLMVNSVEASPHDPAKAYAAITRYKFNDFTPMAYKTVDYGATWTRIADGAEGTGIPSEAWTRVIREDPKRQGLLYMGTELGAFVSFDDGGNWQSLSLNMPVAAITDLIVQRRDNDLVASTAGRSFWILDDLSPLQQLDDEVRQAELHLFEPEAARRGGDGSDSSGSRVGKNPPGPATLDFFLAELPEDGDLTLEIRDENGAVVRRFKGEVDHKGEPRETEAVGAGVDREADEAVADGEIEAESDGEAEDEVDSEEEAKQSSIEKAEEDRVTKFKLRKGMNRVAWDLRHQQVLPIPGRFVFGSLAGRTTVPGTYTVRVEKELASGQEPLYAEAQIEVLPDPREEASASDYRAQSDFLDQVDADLEQINRSVLRLQATRSQLESFLDASRDHEASAEVSESGQALIEELTTVEGLLIQKKTVDGQTVINFTPALDFHYVYLRNSAGGSEGVVTQGDRLRYDDLNAQWLEVKERLDQALGADLEAFNQLVRDRQVPTINVP